MPKTTLMAMMRKSGIKYKVSKKTATKGNINIKDLINKL
jgi:hypothetical protein